VASTGDLDRNFNMFVGETHTYMCWAGERRITAHLGNQLSRQAQMPISCPPIPFIIMFGLVWRGQATTSTVDGGAASVTREVGAI